MSERLFVALRVLSCINSRLHPDPHDIASLRRWVDPSDSSADNDQLARIIIDSEIHLKEVSIRLVTRAVAHLPPKVQPDYGLNRLSDDGILEAMTTRDSKGKPIKLPKRSPLQPPTKPKKGPTSQK